MLGTWPLVGRSEEIQFVSDALSRSNAAGVVLAGAQGVGKTRLASEILSNSESIGFTTYWVIATKSAASIPFGAIAGLLPKPARSGADQLDILRQGIQSLTEGSEGRVLLGVDDAHLLDDASAAFIHQVAHMRAGFLLLTVRTGEQIPDSIQSLWRDGVLQRFEVQALSENEIEELVTSALHGQVSQGTLYELWNASRGNPLLLREFVLGGLDSKTLINKDGVWRWIGPIEPGPRISEVIGARLGRLTNEERKVLEILALGEPLGPDLLEKMVGLAALEEVERKGLVEVRKDERRLLVSLAHPLYSDVVRASIPRLTARSITRRLAEAVEATGGNRREDILRVSRWWLDAGVVANTELLTEAALNALAAFDYELAERLARAAVDAGGGFDASFALADSLRSLGRAREAEDILAELEMRASSDEELVDSGGLRAYNLFFGLDRTAEAERVIKEAEDAVSDPGSRLVLDALRGVLALYAGKPVEALEAALRVLDEPNPPDKAAIQAIVAGASAFAVIGQPAKAEELIARGQDVVSSIPLEAAYYTGQLLAGQVLILWLSGRLAEAESVAEATYRVALAQGIHDGIAIMLVALGRIAIGQGRVSLAAERLREAAALLREHDRIRFLPWALGALALAYANMGEIEAARAALAEGDRVCPDSVRIFAVEYEISRAWVAAAAGEESKAREIARVAAELAAETGQGAFESTALHTIARLGDPQSVVDRLKELGESVDTKYLPAFTAHAVALIKEDGPALDEVSLAFEGIGANLLAAESAAQAARAHRVAGRIASAMSSAERAKVLASKCGGALTSALNLSEPPASLTRREREVAALASRGLTSRQIAENLVLSTRTVENHLYRVYSKLGVSSRDELVEILGPAG